ncbi:dihydrolipoamide acetyltransferase family protein [Subtercola boreus]
MTTFTLPDVGEGLTEAEIVLWRVAPGDVVNVNDPLVEIETAKSIVEIPSPYAGTVETLHGETGATLAVNSPLVTIRTVGEVPVAGGTGVAEVTEAAGVADAVVAPAPADPEPRPLVLVGSGPSVAASRRFHLPMRDSAVAGVTGVVAAETRVPIRGMRKATAAAVTASAFTAPHVTEWLTVDVTSTLNVVAALRADRGWQGVRVTPLLLVARALVVASQRFPGINASWDEATQEIVTKHYVNLGIAAATPRGLLVPNIKDAGRLGLRDLAESLADLVATARAGTTAPAALAHGTITITNIGALGVDAGTPILNPGEAAILAFGRIRPMPWVVGDEVVVRQVAQFALSFDHRLVDGELGSNVLAEVGSILTDPWRAAL